MNTFSKMFNGVIAILFIAMSNIAHASDFSVLMSGDQSISIQIDQEYDGVVHLVLRDKLGVVYHQESALNASIKNRSIDLQFIPIGGYHLLVEYDNIIKLQPITKLDGFIQVDANELKTTFVPSVRQAGDRLDLDMLFLGEFEVELTLTSAGGDVVYNNVKSHVGAYHRRLGLQGLEEGEYIFLIKITSQQTTKTFNTAISRTGLASK